ncbi:uncharacterized protein LOC131685529 [Topomyia yanbarensis]|uniref:uncharacterized protein LOC131685529 n=1 Tax=Topomyia yanbarensis TaxID=2498891 RepID=UPI00273C3DBC|nr:uncharacterized protein LOC131685529 [Topomyia yanbarensis]
MTGFLKLTCLLLAATIPNIPAALGQYQEDTEVERNPNSTYLPCWSCVSKYKTWTDCQNSNEKEDCELMQGESEESLACMKSTVNIRIRDGDSYFYRIAGCAMNESALQQAYMDQFEVTFNQTGETNVTLVEYSTCLGSLCNVMDEVALQRGPVRVVKLNVIDVNSGVLGSVPLIGLIVAVFGILLVM